MALNEKQLELCRTSRWDYTDLRALFLNCTLKRSPELSHTEGLIEISRAIMEENGVTVAVLRPVDHDIAYGVHGDMTEHGAGSGTSGRPSSRRSRRRTFS